MRGPGARDHGHAADARAVIDTALTRLRRATGKAYVVVLVDGLEKLTWLSPDDRRRNEDHADATFGTHAEYMQIPAYIVYTFPLWLRFRQPHLGTRYTSPTMVLPMIKILGRDGQKNGPGCEGMYELVRRRIPAIAEVFGADRDDTLEDLILASGGYPRDLLRMLRDALQLARDFPISREIAERVITRMAEDYAMAALPCRIDLLAQIARTHRLPTGPALADITPLVDRLLILTYRNGTEWHDVHPLLRRSPVLVEAIRALEPQP